MLRHAGQGRRLPDRGWRPLAESAQCATVGVRSDVSPALVRDGDRLSVFTRGADSSLRQQTGRDGHRDARTTEIVHSSLHGEDPVPSYRAVLDAVRDQDPAAAERAMRALFDQAVLDLDRAQGTGSANDEGAGAR